jgi:KDO2-lipid IV(A) lauroyltransferase
MMSALLYWFVLKPISLLPYRVLYLLSDFFFVVFYYVIGYRKKVVRGNLTRSFPEKSVAEIISIEKDFYRHFCDLILESLKNFSTNAQQLAARFEHRNTEILDQLHAEGRSAILAGGHYGNWEMWALSAPAHFRHRLMAIYKRLSNRYFDEKMRSTRGKFGLELVSTKETGDWLHTNRENLFVSVFAIDQSPSNPRKAHWISFLGQETACLFGAEKYAKEFNLAVVFGHLSKVSRGKYAIDYELVTLNPESFGHGKLTEHLSEMLEADIRREPRYWLWSHKRWKHKRPGDL